MEASVAAGQQGAPADGQQGAEQQQGFDPGQLVSSLESIAQGQNETRELLRSLTQERQQTGEEQEPVDPFALDLSFLAPPQQPGQGADEAAWFEQQQQQQQVAPQVDPQQMQAQLAQALSQAVEKGVQAQVAPLQQQVQRMEHAAAAEALAQEFPALQDPETASQVVEIARQFASANGQPDLGEQPWFWRLTYMAAEAAAQANDESAGSDESRAAVLEGQSGALPGGASASDMADSIVGAGQDRPRLPFG